MLIIYWHCSASNLIIAYPYTIISREKNYGAVALAELLEGNSFFGGKNSLERDGRRATIKI